MELRFPVGAPKTRLDSTMIAYRGISHEQFARLTKVGYFSPYKPLAGTLEWIAALDRPAVAAHVLDLPNKRVHAVSFSLSRDPAIWYATTGGTRAGYLVEIMLPATLQVLTQAQEPVAYEGDDGTAWFDPRFVVIGPDAETTAEAQARARQDDELLLIGGNVKPARTTPVSPRHCGATWRPWSCIASRRSEAP